MDEHKLATFLGWFSIGLGAAELLAPRTLTRYLDVGGREPVVRAFGAREVAAGVGILSRRNRTPWFWGRVAGDAVDLGGLVAALRGNRRARFVATAIASVVAVTVLDVVCGMKSSEGPSAPQFA
jgi:hypothetical protein